ncbi:MAG: indole-3-glycerol phosphate synthase TrpC [Spirochaetaceae bacterium]|jgi:indole-3-glycerol phosphate synthase|nr:indole-3-glycerol phosphate synthase TrpC [Spirochaetaceae bacterium]
MNILETLAENARRRVEKAKKICSHDELTRKAREAGIFAGGTFPFEKALSGAGMAFICEIKRASPSKGVIAADFSPMEIARAYEKAGADAISVLTEPDYFLGNDDYVRVIAPAVSVPVLRKDFTVDTYQIYEARILGASAVLLICALLDTPVLAECIQCAASLGLSALVEAHTEDEVHSALKAGARIIGVNNRNLKTFDVDRGISLRMRRLVPPGILFVSESGIQNAGDISELSRAGVNAVLVGETLMRAPDKAGALARLRGGL